MNWWMVFQMEKIYSQNHSYKIVTLVAYDPLGPIGPTKFTAYVANAAVTGSCGVDSAILPLTANELLMGILNGKLWIVIIETHSFPHD